MAITRDVLNLIKSITENKINSLEENAKLMGVSERSIRYKIEDCNYHLQGLELPELKLKLGKISFSSSLDEVVKKIKENINTYNFSQDEREKIILTLYLFGKGKLTIDEISDFLGVSSVTLKSDIKKIKKYVKTFMLDLSAETNRYLELSGEEENVRKLMLDILLKNYDISFKNEGIFVSKTYYYGYFIPWEEMDIFFETEKIKLASEILKSILEKNNKKLSDEAYKVLFFYILIVLNRYEKHSIEHFKNKQFLSNTEEYLSVKNTLEKFDLKEGELLSLTEYFLGSHTFNFDDSFYGNWVQVETFIMSLIKEISKFGYSDLEKDFTLLEGLINHIKPAIYRAKMGGKLDTHIYEEFRESYPTILSQVEEAWSKCDFKNLNMSNEEIAYIAMHFQLAIKRTRKKKLKNILIVCGSGYSTSKFLAESIQEKFSVNIIDTIPYNLLDTYNNLDEVDLIITTIDNLENTYVPVVTVSPILNKEDIQKLEKLNLSQVKSKIKLSKLLEVVKESTISLDEEKFIKELKEKFKGEIFDDRQQLKQLKFTDMMSLSRIELIKNVNDWQEAIFLGSKKLVDENMVNKDYADEIIKLINKFGSYMVIQEGIILAHANPEDGVRKTGIGILYVEDGIDFPDKEKVYLVITLASKDKREHLNGLMEFINIIREKNILKLLKDVKTPSEIFIIIKNLFY
ncbi:MULTISPECIES: BglG family transcription antiterminator [Fusobacterium]|uniref:BglG family transcription antiterminator n=1 Tax=Fusobacterium TaxID=848 RepID=UPI0014774D1D|nr:MULTISPECIES: PTS sugar transporter subunit IIA [Fusobacterium]NME35314.1 PTS transporter subunit EIIA [Fusobacterium sp. FSA-380-WT-3A]